MAYTAVVMPDVEEGGNIEDNLFWVTREDHLETKIRECGRANPTLTICVYRLSEMCKISKQPEYSRYKVNASGEIVPV